MKTSSASRRYARNNRWVLAVTLAFLLATSTGWRAVAKSQAIDPQREPQGQGWFRLVAAEPAELGSLSADSPAALWWNPVQAIGTLISGLLASFVLLLAVEGVMRRAVTRAHARPMRPERRMTAALDYATAWWMPVALGLAVAALAPMAMVGDTARWFWYPSRSAFVLSGAVVVAFGAVLWWFWLVRLGMTAPGRIRARVVSVMALGTVAIVAAAGSIWWYAVPRGLDRVFASFSLKF